MSACDLPRQRAKRALALCLLLLSACSTQPASGLRRFESIDAVGGPRNVTYSEMREHCRLTHCIDENGFLLKYNPPTDADIESLVQALRRLPFG
jgi:hypothetical protein